MCVQVGANIFAFIVALVLAASWITLRDHHLGSVQFVLYSLIYGMATPPSHCPWPHLPSRAYSL